MDLDPFEPVGISAATIRFLDVFLVHCLVADSPEDAPDEIAALGRNQERVSGRGREPDLRLERAGRSVTLAEWAQELLDELEPIAAALDALHGGEDHRHAVRNARAGLGDPRLLPSARLLAAMAAQSDSGFVPLTCERSQATRRRLLELPWSDEEAAEFRALSEASLREQHALEASSDTPFEAFRQQYVSADQL